MALPVALAACSHSQTGALPAAVGLGDAQLTDDPYDRGKAALVKGEIGGAVESFRRALRADPASISALNGLAVAYDEIGRFDVAQGLYRRALTLAPHSTETLNNLGRSLVRQGSAGTALPYLTAAREHASPTQLPVVEANVAAARAVLAPQDIKLLPSAMLERTGAREHLLRTGQTPRRLVAVEPDLRRRMEDSPAGAMPPVQQPTIEISNGVGRRHMAARLAAFLSDQGIAIGRLTNADSFGYARTLILYLPGREKDAIRIAQLLPMPVEPVLDRAQSSGVRVVLGHDLTDFDRQLLSRDRGAGA